MEMNRDKKLINNRFLIKLFVFNIIISKQTQKHILL